MPAGPFRCFNTVDGAVPIVETLYGVGAAELAEDVYFREDFVALHARPDAVASIRDRRFRHSAAIRRVPGMQCEDLETPWGYGGPIGLDALALAAGIREWRSRQAGQGRVAEFVRLHPFLNPMALLAHLDSIRFDRLTVLLDLSEPAANRWRRYGKSTRYSVRKALQTLSLRKLGPGEGAILRRCYEAGLDRNRAERSYYLPPDYFEAILAAPWATTWTAERGAEPLAIACFLQAGSFAHYHLSGGGAGARETFAHYGLLHIAIEHFAQSGARFMHLGGGRTADPGDELLAFKAKFSPRRIPFYTGGMVHMAGEYARLMRGAGDRFLGYRFPPATGGAGAPIELRQAAQADFPSVFGLKCTVSDMLGTGRSAPPEWHAMRTWFETVQARGKRHRLLLAESAGRLLGYVEAEDRPDHVRLTLGLADAPLARGRAPELLQSALRVAGSQGAVRCSLAAAAPDMRDMLSAAGFHAAPSAGTQEWVRAGI